MALIFIDGFDWIPTGETAAALQNELLKRYASVNTTGGTDAITIVGRDGVGTALEWNNDGQQMRTNPLRPTMAADNTVIVGFGLRTPTTTFQNNGALISVYGVTIGTAQSMNIRITNGGVMRFYRGNTFLADFNTLNTNTWYYLEFKFLMQNAGGTLEARINGQTVGSFAGDTHWGSDTDTWISIEFNCPGTGSAIDDIYICDGSGATNNDFLDPVNIRVLYPDGAGNENNWTASDASPGADHYMLVDETPADGDTTYIQSDVIGQRELFSHEDIILTNTILGVQQSACMRVSDGIPRDVQFSTRLTGTTTDNGVITVATTGYDQSLQVYGTNPVNALSWTDTDLNGMEFGIKID